MTATTRDPAAQIRVQLYSKIATALSESATPAQPGRAIVSLFFPGHWIQPNLDPADPRTQYMIANAFNLTLACSWVAEVEAATISDVYKGILDGKEVPLVHLTPDQRKELDQAEAYLIGPDGQPTPAYETYKKHQLSYFEALDNYEGAKATQDNGGATVPPAVVKALKAAAQAWKRQGNQDQVDLAIATMERYQGLEPLVYWRELAARYQDWTRTFDVDSSFQFTTTNPPYERWFDEFGWSALTFDQNDFDRQRRAGGAGLEPRCCCCYPTQEGGDADVTDLAQLDITDFRLTCKLRRINIVRPWLDASVFFSRAWRWSPASIGYGSVISTGGDVTGAVPPTGTMPVFPATALMARDVDVRWKDEQSGRLISQLAGQSREFGFGPFRLTGAAVDEDDHHIWMPDPQIIGFLSTILPRCPNPEPTLPWPLHSALWSGEDRARPVPVSR